MTMTTGAEPRAGAPSTPARLGGEMDGRTFAGSLAELAVPDVLQLLESLKKTGSLHLSGPGGLVFIGLERGRIITCDDGFAPRGALPERATALVTEVLGWPSGSFTFVSGAEGELPPEGEPLSPTAVVLEALRLADELAARRQPGAHELAADRFASANDATPVDPPAALPPPRAAPRRRRMLLAVVLALTAVAAGSAGYLLAARPVVKSAIAQPAPQPPPVQPEVSTLGAALQRAREAATDDEGGAAIQAPGH